MSLNLCTIDFSLFLPPFFTDIVDMKHNTINQIWCDAENETAQKYKMKMNEKHCIYPRRTHSSYAIVFE